MLQVHTGTALTGFSCVSIQKVEVMSESRRRALSVRNNHECVFEATAGKGVNPEAPRPLRGMQVWRLEPVELELAGEKEFGVVVTRISAWRQVLEI